MFELEYVRTDRNGTKYFHDWNCPRCGGAGESDLWIFTGRTCYACGGTGKRTKPLVVKEYTDEYAAKLDARRKAREEAKPKPSEDELKAILEDTKAREAKKEGINADGTGFAYTGKTYAIKDNIKKAGGKWEHGMWIAPLRIETPANVTVTPIKVKYANGWWAVYNALCETGLL